MSSLSNMSSPTIGYSTLELKSSSIAYVLLLTAAGRSVGHAGSAVSGKGGVLPDAGASGARQGVGAVGRRAATGAGPAGRDRDRAVEPVAAAGGVAPLGDRDRCPGGQHRGVRAGRWGCGGVDARGSADPD